MTANQEDQKRDAVLKRMMSMAPETNGELVKRRKKERKERAKESLKKNV